MTWRSLGIPEATKTQRGAAVCWDLQGSESHSLLLSEFPVRVERVIPTIMPFRRLHSLQRGSPRGIYSTVTQQQKWKLGFSATWRHWKSCIQPTARPRDSSGDVC